MEGFNSYLDDVEGEGKGLLTEWFSESRNFSFTKHNE